MSKAIVELRDAELRSKAARSQLTGTLIALQSRLTPKALLQEASDELKARASGWANETLDAVKARPATAAGFVAGVTALLFRDELWNAASKLFRHETEMDDDELNDRMVGEGTG